MLIKGIESLYIMWFYTTSMLHEYYIIATTAYWSMSTCMVSMFIAAWLQKQNTSVVSRPLFSSAALTRQWLLNTSGPQYLFLEHFLRHKHVWHIFIHVILRVHVAFGQYLYINGNVCLTCTWYLYSMVCIGCPRIVRSDRGTENSTVAFLQAFLRRNPQDQLAGALSFQYGRSASNQVSVLGCMTCKCM